MELNTKKSESNQHVIINSGASLISEVKVAKYSKAVKRTVIAMGAALLLSSCSPYASLDIGAPFKVGPVYVNPSIGVGKYL